MSTSGRYSAPRVRTTIILPICFATLHKAEAPAGRGKLKQGCCWHQASVLCPIRWLGLRTQLLHAAVERRQRLSDLRQRGRLRGVGRPRLNDRPAVHQRDVYRRRDDAAPVPAQLRQGLLPAVRAQSHHLELGQVPQHFLARACLDTVRLCKFVIGQPRKDAPCLNIE